MELGNCVAKESSICIKFLVILTLIAIVKVTTVDAIWPFGGPKGPSQFKKEMNFLDEDISALVSHGFKESMGGLAKTWILAISAKMKQIVKDNPNMISQKNKDVFNTHIKERMDVLVKFAKKPDPEVAEQMLNDLKEFYNNLE
ncbi:uncharacterized protein LOC141853974 isoform X2 [Brevipalpus obovatus]|uniref:uncharacterized protein LOC141853974 isoform X2 n=1 Tax=Brevipalpus obovatus TaxID=246614 RepID=UPI003D9E6A40